ncbi:phage minor head protein [Helicobacter typhlonius]|uniref:phage head morphogenesis protein n=1 Tax=Helicobacter typhlonius TaxID=76936 RepID=UPI002FE2C175
MDSINISLDFSTPPYEAIAALQSKKVTSLLGINKDVKAQLKQDFYNKAFVVSKVADIDVLSKIQQSLVNALAKGQSFQSWKKELKPFLEKSGYGDLNNSRLKKIYATNIQSAYAQGRKKAQMQRSSPKEYLKIDSLTDTKVDIDIAKYDDGIYFRYVTMQDSKVRALHAKLHNIILPRKHPFWDRYYPPNDFGCRCRVEVIYANELLEKGLKPTHSLPLEVAQIIPKDFTPKSPQDDLRNIIELKLKTYINNNTATNALHKIMQEVDIRNERFRKINELWEGKDLKKTTHICRTPQLLKDIFNTEAEYISIGASVISAHKTRHPEIDSFDYSLIADMIEDIYGIYQDEQSNVKYLVASKLGRWYRLSLKSLSDKKEIWVESLVSIRDKDTLLKKLKNKKVIYQKDGGA